MRNFVLFSRRGCHLCEQMLEELEPLCRGRVHLVVEDVDTRPEWQKTHGDNVPVLVADGQEVCRYRLDRGAVLELIRDTDQDT